MQDPRSQQYLEQHGIPLLFQQLFQSVLFEKPSDPAAFICAELMKRKTVPKTPGAFFDRQDLGSLFDLIDVTQKGKITAMQAQNALINLRVPRERIPEALAKHPQATVSKEEFIRLSEPVLESC